MASVKPYPSDNATPLASVACERTLADTWLILLNWNGLHHLQYCIPSLLQSHIGGAHILLVDNASTDGSIAFATQYLSPTFQILRLDENKGWAGGNNAGIRHALQHNALFIVCLNNDMRFSKSWLLDILRGLELEPRAGIGGSRIVHTLKELTADSNATSPFVISDHIDGCCMLSRASVYRRIGLFDEEYFMYCEEDDFQQRALRAGYLLIETASPVWHQEEGTSAAFPAMKSYLSMRNTMLLFRRFEPLWMFPVIAGHLFLCATFKNYRKHSISNRRCYAGSVAQNLRLFFWALLWNCADVLKRGFRGRTNYPMP